MREDEEGSFAELVALGPEQVFGEDLTEEDLDALKTLFKSPESFELIINHQAMASLKERLSYDDEFFNWCIFCSYIFYGSNILEEKKLESLNTTDGKRIDQYIDRKGGRENFFTIDPKTYKETPIKEAIAEFVHKWLKTVSFKERIYCYDCIKGIYAPDTGQVKGIIQEFARRCDRQDLIPAMQTFVPKHLLGINVYTEYPFNRPCYRIPFKNKTLFLSVDGKKWIPKDISPEDMVTWRIPHNYNPTAPKEPVLTVFREWVDGRDAKILIQIAAHALYHQALTSPFKIAYLLIGLRDAAKSSFICLLELAFTGMISKVSLQEIGKRFKNAEMEGKLFNAYDDLKNTAMHNTGEFKNHRGKFEHSIENKGEKPYDGYIKCVYLFASNPPLPKVENINDDAFFGSWQIVVFENQFPKDPTWCEWTFTEDFIAGFFNLVLQEYISIMNHGLHDPLSPESVRDIWLGTSEEGIFVKECLEEKPENEIDVELCYDLYVNYKVTKGEKPKDRAQFGKGMVSQGYTKHRPRRGEGKGKEKRHVSVYWGIGVKLDSERVMEPGQKKEQQEIGP